MEIEGIVGKHVKGSEELRRLQTLPGVGVILGLTIYLESGPMERFENAGRYASYCRLVDSRRTSNEKVKGQHNAKSGSAYLEWAFVEAANFAQQYYPVARSWFDRKKAKTNRTAATKALACKLCKASCVIRRRKIPFTMSIMFGSQTAAVSQGGDCASSHGVCMAAAAVCLP